MSTITPAPVSAPAPEAPKLSSPIPGLNVLLIGGAGTGKTKAIETLVKASVTPFIIFTEPGMDVASEWIEKGKYHYAFIPPARVPFSVLAQRAKVINTLSFEALKKFEDPQKTMYSQFFNLCTRLNAFECDCCKKQWGDVATWNTDRAIVIDTLSGLSTMSLQLTVGGKPSPHQGEWGTAMSNIEGIVNTLCNATQCHFIMNAHLDREVDEIAGSSVIMAATLGRKLAPKLPYNFTDVVLAKRLGTVFTWSTTEPGVDLKARNLQWGKDISADFSLLIETWKKRGGVIVPT